MVDFAKHTKVNALRQEGYQLFQDGLIELSRIEANGIRIDVPRLQKTKMDIKEKLRTLREELEQEEPWKIWRKIYGSKANLTSRDQLERVLHKEMGYKVLTWTETGRAQMNKEALQEIGLPFTKKLIRFFEYDKAYGTYLKGIEREIVGDRIHPSFNLHLARSFRSCVAKGTMIEVMRDLSKHPKGIPIEKVKVGDYVYCYNDQLNLTLRRVLWAGKTGHRKVVRVHWGACGRKGFLDVTPEHRIRLSDGRYVQARHLVGDYRLSTDSKYGPRIRVLAMSRHEDVSMIYQTGRTKRIHDARLIYESLVRPLGDWEVVHHKDLNHFNNSTLKNLEAKSKSNHARDHALNGDFWTDEDRMRGARRRLALHKKFGDRWSSGSESPNWIHITKFKFLRMLSECGGMVVRLPHDFDVMRNKARFLGVDLKAVKDRYDKDGRYISRGRLLRAFNGNVVSLVKAFGSNHQKSQRLLKQRGLVGNLTRECPNPWGRKGKPHNHRIIRIEYLEKEVDVYDIEVDECHNFIANEICVHNSCNDPNFQNMPIRDKEVSELVRGHIIPSMGNCLVENDFRGLEVFISAAYHQDPVFIKYIKGVNGEDMHKDMAIQIYKLEKVWDKLDPKMAKDIRYGAKNRFVFPQFYGDYYVACAKNCWEWIRQGKLKGPDGESLYKHLKRQGIAELGKCDPEERPRPGTFEAHMKAIEDDFWGRRFRVYGQWRRDWYNQYLEKGHFDLLSGFRVFGSFKRNAVVNYPVQGSAFHCLLWSLIRVNRLLRKYKMKSMIVGQIHDSLVSDVRTGELRDFLEIVERVTTHDLRNAWQWITVPLEIEYEIAPEGANWYQKREVKFKNGRFLHPKDPTKSTTDPIKFLKTLAI